jgi:hypothetical protein
MLSIPARLPEGDFAMGLERIGEPTEHDVPRKFAADSIYGDWSGSQLKNRLRSDLSEWSEYMSVMKDQLHDSCEQLTRKVVQEPSEHPDVRACAEGLTRFFNDACPGESRKEIAKAAGWSSSSMYRLETGEKVPRIAELNGIIQRLETAPGAPRFIDGATKDSVRELCERANEVPRNLYDRLQRAQSVAREAIAVSTGIIDRIDVLRTKITSIEDMLDEIAASATTYNWRTRQSILDPDTAAREQELRRQLAEAKAELEEVLCQEREDYPRLVHHAKKLVEATDAFLLATKSEVELPAAIPERVAEK